MAKSKKVTFNGKSKHPNVLLTKPKFLSSAFRTEYARQAWRALTAQHSKYVSQTGTWLTYFESTKMRKLFAIHAACDALKVFNNFSTANAINQPKTLQIFITAMGDAIDLAGRGDVWASDLKKQLIVILKDVVKAISKSNQAAYETTMDTYPEAWEKLIALEIPATIKAEEQAEKQAAEAQRLFGGAPRR